MNNILRLSEVLHLMNQRNVNGVLIPFNLKVRSFNIRNKSGGKLVTYENYSLKPLKSSENYEKALDLNSNPNHFKNRTRNIINDNGDIRKIHIDFITEFNGKIVVY